MRHCRVLAFLLFACFHAPAQQATKEPDLPNPVDLVWAVKIPMRDGVRLNATVYRPHGQKEALPIIFELAPYISDSYHSRAYYFAQHGYVFAIVDVRGRGNSEGEFEPFLQEPHDGHDIVEWLARQSCLSRCRTSQPSGVARRSVEANLSEQ
jgi:predicted acyl esterase